MTDEFVSSPERLAAMRDAIMNNTSFPDSTALGAESGRDVYQLMLHFNRDDDLRCSFITDEEQEFIGEVFMRLVDNPRFRPKRAELATIRALNLKFELCGRN